MGKKYIYFQSHLEHNHDQRMLSEIFVASKKRHLLMTSQSFNPSSL